MPNIRSEARSSVRACGASSRHGSAEFIGIQPRSLVFRHQSTSHKLQATSYEVPERSEWDQLLTNNFCAIITIRLTLIYH